MGKIYGEEDVTWATIEKIIPYSRVVWSMGKDGIPRYKLLDDENREINVELEVVK